MSTPNESLLQRVEHVFENLKNALFDRFGQEAQDLAHEAKTQLVDLAQQGEADLKKDAGEAAADVSAAANPTPASPVTPSGSETSPASTSPTENTPQ